MAGGVALTVLSAKGIEAVANVIWCKQSESLHRPCGGWRLNEQKSGGPYVQAGGVLVTRVVVGRV